MLIALLLGCMFGFVTAIPIAGPISAVVFSHGMKGRYRQGRLVAFGAGLVESGYTFLAFWGFSQLVANFKYIIAVSNGVAAVVLALLGLHFYRSKKMRTPSHAHHPEHESAEGRKAFLVGAGMSAVNLSLIATWTAAITTLYSMDLFVFSTLHAAAFSAGVCVGIVSWFSLMLQFMAKHRNELAPATLDKGLKAMGILLMGVSVWMIVRMLK